MRLRLSCCRRVVVVTDIQHFSSTSSSASSVRSVWGWSRSGSTEDVYDTARSQSEHFCVLVALLLRVCRGVKSFVVMLREGKWRWCRRRWIFEKSDDVINDDELDSSSIFYTRNSRSILFLSDEEYRAFIEDVVDFPLQSLVWLWCGKRRVPFVPVLFHRFTLVRARLVAIVVRFWREI